MYSLDDDKTVIYDKNSDKVANCSVLAKLVAARIVIDSCQDYATEITVPAAPVRELDKVKCSRVGLLVGEVISVRELLYCFLIANAADAGNVLAYYFGNGSIPAFVDKMNAFAADHGCVNTFFADPNGLKDDVQKTTAKEIGLLYEACLENEFFKQIVGMTRYDMPATNRYKEIRYLRTTNLTMVSSYKDYYNSNIINGKYGTDKDANGYIVTTATKDGYTYLCVILNGATSDYDSDGLSENMAMVESAKLYSWTFRYIKLRVVAKTSTIVTEVKVNHSDAYDYVSLVPMIEVSALVPDGVDSESVYITPIAELTREQVDAPIHKGDVLGVASILYAGEEIARVDLVASFDVERSYLKFITGTILDFLTGKVFVGICLTLILAVAVLFVVHLFVTPDKKHKRRNIRVVKGYEVLDKKEKAETRREE